ncbi:hypothetical protein [Gulosibacter bifidus]|uniref:Uncharacterized protein n=1 Tax=Gulosibacter bifidus TaxID=272239 RepID=A0ABW5RI37_9MICO
MDTRPKRRVHAIQYSHDAINNLDTFGVRTPNSLEAFEKVYIPSPSGDGGQDHALIAKGLDENRAGVAAIVDEIID